ERGPLTDEDLPAIEAEMRRIIAADEPLVREVWEREDVRALFEKQGERFKAEWVMELPDGETITMYRTGDGKDAWIDLCRGPHLASTGKLDPQSFKLTRVSGAYWRGDPKNPMLSRIYGTAWLNKKQLDEYLKRLEEAAKRGLTSDRELPLRLAEYGCCHRNEPHGALHGIMRVRQFTQDDGHIFCTRDQLVDETKRFCALLDLVYRDLGFPDYQVKLATRPDERIGSAEAWTRAEADLETALKETGLDYQIPPGEGAYHGPNPEFHLTDAIRRTRPCW